jgi:spore coat polysaccharide biosynthesis protein SpsF
MKTEQEQFWAGAFGDEYSTRNQGPQLLASNRALFTDILRRTRGVGSVLELGANVGNNLRALRDLLPSAKLAGVELNATAAQTLAAWGDAEVFNQSLFDFKPDRRWDLVLIKGTLIHVAPEKLPDAYDVAASAANRYVCLVEYYNPAPVEVSYRGHSGKLFKRDFARELMQRHPQFELVDYGFAYRGDPNFPQDDVTWFVMERPLGSTP